MSDTALTIIGRRRKGRITGVVLTVLAFAAVLYGLALSLS